MIKNVIFDLGNVLLSFKPMEFLYELIPDKKLANQIYEVIFKSKEWLMLDKGVITHDEAVNIFCERDSTNRNMIKKAMESWIQMLTPIEDTVNTLLELKQAGYKVYYLSNFQLLAHEDVNRRYDFFKYFDGGIASYKENLLKPEKEIYIKLTKLYGIKAEESVFIDDVRENAEGARELGFYAIQFINADDLRIKLKELNVL